MQCPVLLSAEATPEDFVECWNALYSGYDEGFYQQNLGQPLTDERIQKWFEWKNGGPLAATKQQSILRYSLPEERLHAGSDDASVRAFLNRDGGAIWRIFWLHLQHPNVFPIYDQHVHRAMAFILGWDKWEIPVHNPTKVSSYLDHYRPFFKQFSELPHRKVDRALWSFGKFLSSEYRAIIPTDVIPRAWLQTRIGPDDSDYASAVEKFRVSIKEGDELWLYDEPAPPGVNAGELGVALVRKGRVIQRVMLGVH